jgi:hypothetical protein
LTEALDPFWQAAADHVAALSMAPSTVFAPTGFDALLPGCRTRADTPVGMVLAALVLHKGRLGEVPADILLHALDHLTVTFANEVFLVFTGASDPVAPDNPHVMAAMLVAALRAVAAAPPPATRAARMPATYMGQGRVLLETAFGHLMLANGADTAIVPHLIRDGWFDRNLTDVITGLLHPGMSFIDIGANFGTYTLIGAQAVGDEGRVIAIEPSPAIAALLLENVIMNGFAGRCHARWEIARARPRCTNLPRGRVATRCCRKSPILPGPNMTRRSPRGQCHCARWTPSSPNAPRIGSI